MLLNKMIKLSILICCFTSLNNVEARIGTHMYGQYTSLGPDPSPKPDPGPSPPNKPSNPWDWFKPSKPKPNPRPSSYYDPGKRDTYIPQKRWDGGQTGPKRGGSAGGIILLVIVILCCCGCCGLL